MLLNIEGIKNKVKCTLSFKMQSEQIYCNFDTIYEGLDGV